MDKIRKFKAITIALLFVAVILAVIEISLPFIPSPFYEIFWTHAVQTITVGQLTVAISYYCLPITTPLAYFIASLSCSLMAFLIFRHVETLEQQQSRKQG
jgi:hypothetical protein